MWHNFDSVVTITVHADLYRAAPFASTLVTQTGGEQLTQAHHNLSTFYTEVDTDIPPSGEQRIALADMLASSVRPWMAQSPIQALVGE